MSQQLESLYPNLVGCDPCNPCAKPDPCCNSGTGKFAYFILWWLILVVIIWFIIYSLQPSWIMKNNCGECGEEEESETDDKKKHHHHKHNHKCQIDQGKAILISVIIALIIVIIFYFVARSYWY
jgi:hypothetical protein